MDNKLKLPDYTLVTESDFISFLIVTKMSHITFVVYLCACWPCCASLDADREKNVQQGRNYTMRLRSTAYFRISHTVSWIKPSS
jgi:hypothetical protein